MVLGLHRQHRRFVEGRLALAWLAFAPRVSRWQAISLEGAGFSGENARDPAVAFGPNAAQGDIYAIFEEEQLLADRSLSREDFKATFLQLCDTSRQRPPGLHSPGLAAWLQCIRERFDIVIDFADRGPRVAQNSLSGWCEVTATLDGDALICLTLAETRRAADIELMDRWKLTPVIGDRDLAVLMGRGVSDMHLHVGGLRNAQVVWLQMIAGLVEPEQLDYFATSRIERLVETTERKRRFAEKACILDLRNSLLTNCEPRLRETFHQPLFWAFLEEADEDALVSGNLGPEHLPRLLRRERYMLTRGFERLLEYQRIPPSDRQGEIARRRLEHALDIYVFAKSRFIWNHQQSVRSNPGLSRHRQLSDSTKLDPGSIARGRRALSRVRGRAHLPLALYLLQSSTLQRVELRVAPAGRHRGYQSFLDEWRAMEDQVPSSFTDSGASSELLKGARFAVHFKRSLDRRRGGFGAFLQEIDRDSAALHTFRLEAQKTLERSLARKQWHGQESKSDRIHPAARVARLDFAGQERDIFPDRIAFVVNLLRGDAEAQDLLDDRCYPGFHGHWLALRAKGEINSPIGLPRLGVTCHAGEDYAHPLEGIHAMMTAVTALKMKAGDSIGHGLAIGRDVAQFHKEFAPKILTEAGAQFDALVWLRQVLVTYGPESFSAAAQRIEVWLWDEIPSLYSERKLHALNLAELEALARLRQGPILRHDVKLQSLAEELWLHEVWGGSPDLDGELTSNKELRESRVPAMRRRRVPLAPVLYDLEEAISWAQAWVAREIAERGIVLEFNPSSNWRMSQARTPGEIPFIAVLRKYGSSVLASINTDNAGAYNTRIENEYAIALEGLRESGLSRLEALELLERMRTVGLNLIA